VKFINVSLPNRIWNVENQFSRCYIFVAVVTKLLHLDDMQKLPSKPVFKWLLGRARTTPSWKPSDLKRIKLWLLPFKRKMLVKDVVDF